MKACSKKKVSRTILVVILALLIAVSATTQIALADGPVLKEMGDIVAVLGSPPPNPCTDEFMVAQGKVVKLLFDTGGGMVLHVNGAGATMTGVDTNTAYRFNGALNIIASADGDFHSVHHFSWFSPTNGDSFIMTYVSHLTVNANGDVTSYFEFENGECMKEST